jgi:dUTP pyrophosphatase
MKVNIVDIELPGKIEKHKGDWYDLAASDTVYYKQGEAVMIPLGFSMQIPKGYEGRILPRSSLFIKTGLLHASSGLIDESYSGRGDMWFFLGYATKDGVVKRGQRICQFRLMKHGPELEFEDVSISNSKNRGGFGSTGE